MRVGTRVRVAASWYGVRDHPENVGRTGTICAVRVPGQTSKSGTAGFKFVKFEDGTVRGFFTRELARIK